MMVICQDSKIVVVLGRGGVDDFRKSHVVRGGQDWYVKGRFCKERAGIKDRCWKKVRIFDCKESLDQT